MQIGIFSNPFEFGDAAQIDRVNTVRRAVMAASMVMALPIALLFLFFQTLSSTC